MKKLFISIFCIIVFNHSFSQVQLQTGAAQASIPLYSYNDPVNRLGINISLDYIMGNGLKVSSMASSVGTGWNLTCQGYIQRIQNGEPDDQKNADNYTYPTTQPGNYDYFWTNWSRDYYPNGYLYSEFSPSDQIPNAGAYTPMTPSGPLSAGYAYYKSPQKYQADREQDVFKFSFNGREGYFVISRKNANGVSEIRTIYDSKLKIEKIDGDLNNSQDIRTTISQFIITDENGIRYLFSDAELDQVCLYNYKGNGSYLSPYPVPNANLSYPSSMPVRRGAAVNSFVKNKWHLTEISNPLTNKKIQFQYESYNVDIEGEKILKLSSYNNLSKVNVTLERIKGVSKRLKKIILSDKESVVFEYSYANRMDLNFDESLSSLVIMHGDQLKYKWVFEYGYFVKNSIKSPTDNFSDEDKTWARLCLLKFNKIGPFNVSEPPYMFNYYMGNEDNNNSAIPAMFSVQQDSKGYYSTFSMGFYNPSNGSVSISNSPYEPTIGSLYPSSFYSSILLRLNYNVYSATAMMPTIEARNGIIKSIQNPLGGTFKFDYELNRTLTSNYPFYYGVRVYKTTEFDGVNHANDKIVEYKYIKEDGNSSLWGYEFPIHNQSIPTLLQDCGSNYRPGNNPNGMTRSISSYVIFNNFNLKAITGTAQIGGMAVPNIVIYLIVNAIVDLFEDWFGSGSNSEDFNMSEYNSGQINNGNDLPFQYSRVEVVNETGNENNGKTVYEFTSPSTSSSYSIDFPTLSYPYANKQRCAYWIYGIPQKISIYDKDNSLLKQTINAYNPTKTILNNSLYQSQRWLPSKYVYACPFNPPSSEQTAYDKIATDIYYPITGRIELAETKEYTYQDNNYSLVTTNYEYSADNYQVKKVTTTNSKGELVEANTYYPADYSLSGAVQTMKDNNMINVPIATQTFITKGSNSYLLNGTVNDFAPVPGGDIRPLKTYSFQNAAPVDKSSVLFSANQLIPNTQYYKQTSAVTYGTAGFPSQISILNGSEKQRTVSKIYDYDDKFLVAEVAGATLDEIAYTSFEANGKGAWSYTGYTQNGKSPTGNWSYILDNTGSITKASLNSLKTYIVSYWSKNGAYAVSGTVSGGPKTLRTISIDNNSWTLFEHKVTGVNAVTISGSGSLDELRLYPEGAEMTTYTYDPVKGVVTSGCGTDNRPIYYQYDVLGRVLLILDENRKIIKQYCYNYSGQTEGCNLYGNVEKTSNISRDNCEVYYAGTQVSYTVSSNTYYAATQTIADAMAQAEIDANGQNNANAKGSCLPAYYSVEKSGTFTKNDCGSGYMGSAENYIVPAGTHVSTVSQDDANALAQADVDANGQNNANSNGSCTPTFTFYYIDDHYYYWYYTTYFTLTNTNTNEVFYFQTDPYATAAWYDPEPLGELPEGPYDIEMYNSNLWLSYTMDCYGNESGYPTATYYNKWLYDGCNTITIN